MIARIHKEGYLKGKEDRRYFILEGKEINYLFFCDEWISSGKTIEELKIKADEHHQNLMRGISWNKL